MKNLMDDKLRGGLQLPNFRLYHKAICLTWIKDWVVLTNKKLLNLEGFNRRYGWHSYLLYDKLKVDKMFAHHYIRNSLLNTWLKYVRRLEGKRPLEIIDLPSKNVEDKVVTYQDFIVFEERKFKLKNAQDLPISTDWFQYFQVRNLFDRDNKVLGFRNKNSKLEKILLAESRTSISDIYKLLLMCFTEDEVVKNSMVK